MVHVYRFLHIIIFPLFVIGILARIVSGKEDKKRLKERFGVASLKRDFSKKLIWIHCASVGESLSVLPMINRILDENQNVQVLITTGTVTSAELMAKKLPEGAFHQYVPLDYNFCVRRFIKYWNPDLSVFTESELWVNLVSAAPNKIIINGRMSDRSFARYFKLKRLANFLLDGFDCIFTQSNQDYERFSELTTAKVVNAGNIKYDGDAPQANKNELKILQEVLADRKIMVAASTHSKEEEKIINIYKRLKQNIDNLILILIPRHPNRGLEIVKIIKDSGLGYRQRSENKNIESFKKVDVYLADTLGEMGLWFNLADVVLMGGSLVPHGGHNPLEPLKCGKSTISGPYMHNFREMSSILIEKKVLKVCDDEADVQEELKKVLLDKENKFQTQAEKVIKSLTGATDIILDYISSRIS